MEGLMLRCRNPRGESEIRVVGGGRWVILRRPWGIDGRGELPSSPSWSTKAGGREGGARWGELAADLAGSSSFLYFSGPNNVRNGLMRTAWTSPRARRRNRLRKNPRQLNTFHSLTLLLTLLLLLLHGRLLVRKSLHNLHPSSALALLPTLGRLTQALASLALFSTAAGLMSSSMILVGTFSPSLTAGRASMRASQAARAGNSSSETPDQLWILTLYAERSVRLDDGEREDEPGEGADIGVGVLAGT